MYNKNRVLVRLEKLARDLIGKESRIVLSNSFVGLILVTLSLLAGFQRKRRGLLIFKPDRIGDFVIAIGAIRCLFNKYPEEESTIVCSPIVADLAKKMFPKASIVVVDPFKEVLSETFLGCIKTIWQLSRKRHIQAISLRHQLTFWQELMWFSVSSPRRIAFGPPQNVSNTILRFSTKGLRASNPTRYPKYQYPATTREFSSNLSVVAELIGEEIRESEIHPKLLNCGSEIRESNSLYIFPFGSTSIRDIPHEILGAALVLLQNESLAQEIILLHSPEQREKYSQYSRRLEEIGVKNIILKVATSVPRMVEEICGATLVMATETGPAHIAIAADRFLVGIIGGGHFGMFAPWTNSDKQQWINSRIECYNCDWRCPYPTPICITQISSKEIFEAACILFKRALARPN
jgi:ADP-heptose:LPS heptosyltransferase